MIKLPNTGIARELGAKSDPPKIALATHHCRSSGVSRLAFILERIRKCSYSDRE